jgi:hypothetical protein
MSTELVDAMVLAILEQPLPGDRKTRDFSDVRTAIKEAYHHNDTKSIARMLDASKKRVRSVHAERLRNAHTLETRCFKRTHTEIPMHVARQEKMHDAVHVAHMARVMQRAALDEAYVANICLREREQALCGATSLSNTRTLEAARVAQVKVLRVANIAASEAMRATNIAALQVTHVATLRTREAAGDTEIEGTRGVILNATCLTEIEATRIANVEERRLPEIAALEAARIIEMGTPEVTRLTATAVSMVDTTWCGDEPPLVQGEDSFFMNSPMLELMRVAAMASLEVTQPA